ncbi:signal peptidase I [Candidatus Woesearchaeota archaeon]|jgi:signal peptidase I|nr:signal peptidase I [Candidatus Woesearchaeota archaeon]MBT4387620.1 signal peptidase I [Candidatus Woesearchaeota archaeon]MBT4596017.1 signal peptidase I [Candidatus Woesearchaeota archaeon]MBT5740724.1 signal peptidase I [Candidatus Woesearchaeota archaeon]MBT7297131.1 signal peptidase I [Candidatus Woesearchaeota archaeon]
MLKKLKQFYRYIVYDESLTSLVLSTVISLLFIIFIFYPLLGWSLNSNFPIVAIQSGSMHHEGSFENWWGSKADCSNTFCKQSEYYTNINITKNDFLNYDYSNGFNKGDVMVIMGKDNYQIGDVIVFQTNDPTPIIHRVIKKKIVNNNTIYQTKGDFNEKSIFLQTRFYTLIDEFNINEKNIYGKAVFRIPYLGWIKIIAWQIFVTPIYLIAIIILIGIYYYFKNKLF